MSKDKSLRIRVDEQEFAKLEAYAHRQGISMSQVIRQYIRRLPKPCPSLTPPC